MKTVALLFACSLFASPFASAQETYGIIKSTTKLRGDGTQSTTLTDTDKRTAEETITTSGGKVLQKIIYQLGERDLAVGATFFDAKGKAVYKVAYERDAVGHVTATAFSSPDDRYLGKRVFVYGAGDTATQVIDYDSHDQVIPQSQTAAKAASKKRR